MDQTAGLLECSMFLEDSIVRYFGPFTFQTDPLWCHLHVSKGYLITRMNWLTVKMPKIAAVQHLNILSGIGYETYKSRIKKIM